MKKEWFEVGPDGVSPFERLSKTKGFGAAGTAAAFRALLAGEDVGRTADAKDAEIAELRESLERSRLALNTTREQRDKFWSQRDTVLAERDALRARIDAGVRAWEKWKQQCGSLWLWAFPGATTSQAWSDVCDALDADYVVYPIEQPADERKGERREKEVFPHFVRRRGKDRRRTAGTIADRGQAS